MVAVVFKNNATSRLGINVAAASITVTLEPGTGARFPSPGALEFFPLVVKDERTSQFEIMYCTQRVNDILTVDRAQEGTVAQDWLLGASAWSTATAGVFETYFNYSWSKAEADTRFVEANGDVMTGALTLSGDPTVALHATTKQWVEALVATITSLSEAPNNGMIYGRKSLGWTQTIEQADYLSYQSLIATEQSGQDLRLDNIEGDVVTLFATKLDDAPIDGIQYIRQDGSWSPLTAALTDAPADGNKYVRKDNLWLDLSAAVLLVDIKTVDGAGSGLDADLLDGLNGAAYLDRANHTGTQAQATVTNLVADLALKAPLAAPTFTGVPAAPTAAPGTNTTQIATTAFVAAADALKANLASPTFTGVPAAPTAAPGTNTTQLATTAFVAALGALKADIASPTFTGVPAAPTAIPGTSTTQLATTAFVNAITVYDGIAGLILTNDAGDLTNDLATSVGAATDFTNSYRMALAAALIKRLDANWVVGTNQGGLDTGAVGNNAYYGWLIARPDTGVVDVLYSLSATAPTMPANYTRKALIGKVERVGGVNTIPQSFSRDPNEWTKYVLAGLAVQDIPIADWVNVIEISCVSLSTAGATIPNIQLGDAGGVENTGYVGSANIAVTNNPNSASAFSTAFFFGTASALNTYTGRITLTRTIPETNTWQIDGNLALGNIGSTITFAGHKSTSAQTTTLRIGTSNGVDTFDSTSTVRIRMRQ